MAYESCFEFSSLASTAHNVVDSSSLRVNIAASGVIPTHAGLPLAPAGTPQMRSIALPKARDTIRSGPPTPPAGRLPSMCTLKRLLRALRSTVRAHPVCAWMCPVFLLLTSSPPLFVLYAEYEARRERVKCELQKELIVFFSPVMLNKGVATGAQTVFLVVCGIVLVEVLVIVFCHKESACRENLGDDGGHKPA